MSLVWALSSPSRGIILNLSPIDQQDSATVYHPHLPTCPEKSQGFLLLDWFGPPVLTGPSCASMGRGPGHRLCLWAGNATSVPRGVEGGWMLPSPNHRLSPDLRVELEGPTGPHVHPSSPAVLSPAPGWALGTEEWLTPHSDVRKGISD